jgi:hypothetical protein
MTIEEGFWLFFPEGLRDYFDMKGHREFVDDKTGGRVWEFIFEEKNELPSDYNEADYEAKDFVEKRILDLPIRRRAVELLIRRRRWRHKLTGQILKRDLSFLAKGGKYTAELADFLKGGD